MRGVGGNLGLFCICTFRKYIEQPLTSMGFEHNAELAGFHVRLLFIGPFSNAECDRLSCAPQDADSVIDIAYR